MANFYTDNDDIRFLFQHMDVARVATIMEEDFRFADEFDFAPENPEDALDNYERILTSFGQVCGDVIAPRYAMSFARYPSGGESTNASPSYESRS